VKDAILAEINLISARIDSLHVPTAANPNKEPLWAEVVKGKEKITSTQHRDPYNISNKKRNKIVILGESHATGCASEVQHNLDHTFKIQGTVKPGANLEGIFTSTTNTTTKLTKRT
jgi:hypothetical protein